MIGFFCSFAHCIDKINRLIKLNCLLIEKIIISCCSEVKTNSNAHFEQIFRFFLLMNDIPQLLKSFMVNFLKMNKSFHNWNRVIMAGRGLLGHVETV